MEQIECQVLLFKWQRTCFHFKGGYSSIFLNLCFYKANQVRVKCIKVTILLGHRILGFYMFSHGFEHLTACCIYYKHAKSCTFFCHWGSCADGYITSTCIVLYYSWTCSNRRLLYTTPSCMETLFSDGLSHIHTSIIVTSCRWVIPHVNATSGQLFYSYWSLPKSFIMLH